MKYYLEVNIRFIVLALVLIAGSILILGLMDKPLFSIKEAVKFVVGAYFPLLLFLGCFYMLTYIQLDENEIRVKYFSLFESKLPINEIINIEKTTGLCGVLALGKEQIKIETKKKTYPISIKNMDGFLKTIENYKAK